MAREYYGVFHCSGPYPELVSKHWTLSGAQKAFRKRNRHLFDDAYAERHGYRNTGTFDKIFFVDSEGERREVPYGD